MTHDGTSSRLQTGQKLALLNPGDRHHLFRMWASVIVVAFAGWWLAAERYPSISLSPNGSWTNWSTSFGQPKAWSCSPTSVLLKRCFALLLEPCLCTGVCQGQRKCEVLWICGRIVATGTSWVGRNRYPSCTSHRKQTVSFRVCSKARCHAWNYIHAC